MKLLLDTCVLIWLAQDPSQLSGVAREAIDDASNELWLSHASVWEINLKHLSGKLTLPEKPRLWLSRQLAIWGIKDQPLDLETIYTTSDMPVVHKDPFDRMLVAQSLTHGFVLVSPDEFFPKYDIKVIW